MNGEIFKLYNEKTTEMAIDCVILPCHFCCFCTNLNHSKRKNPLLFQPQFPAAQVDADDRPLIGDRLGGDGVAQILADPPAEIEPQAAGPLVPPAVAPGVALFKDPGQVLRGDAHASVPDAEGLGILQVDGNTPLPGVFQGVGENLLHHEGEPLLVGEDGGLQGGIVQTQAAANELPGEPPH